VNAARSPVLMTFGKRLISRREGILYLNRLLIDQVGTGHVDQIHSFSLQIGRSPNITRSENLTLQISQPRSSHACNLPAVNVKH
jgi:hypothetical protein